MSDRTARLEQVKSLNPSYSPNGWFQTLERCTHLDLGSRDMSCLPLGVCDLGSLVSLWLCSNELSSLPPEILRLTGLANLDMDDNKLSVLPPEIFRLTGITCLSLNDNQLYLLPPEISQLTGIEELHVYGNPIEELPPEITALTNLKELFIEYDGEISIKRAPRGITNLPCWDNKESEDYSHVRALRFYESEILTPGWTPNQHQIDTWTTLDFSGMKLSAIPESITHLTNLRELSVFDNPIKEIPPWIVNLTNCLATLHIEDPNSWIFSRRYITRAPAILNTMKCWKPHWESKLELYNLLITDTEEARNKAKTHKIEAVATVTSLTPTDLTDPIAKHQLPGTATIGTKMLGKGGQGIVFEGQYLGKTVAIKKVNLIKQGDAINEVLLTKKVIHKNIIEIIGVFISPDNCFCIVMPMASDSLKGYIEKNGRFIKETLTFAQQICDALIFCLSATPKEPLHHCDLKTENILIVDGIIKVADFGMAITRTKSGMSSLPGATKLVPEDQVVGGTEHWQGPEIFDEACKSEHQLAEESMNIGFRGERSDVYAFGLIVWSMTMGEYPFARVYPCDISQRVLKGQRPDISVDIPPAIRHLIRACWGQNYKNRPKLSQIKEYITLLTSNSQITIAELENRLPLTYPPIKEMYHGELYEYLTDKGVSKEDAWKLTQRRVNGDTLLSKSAEDLVQDYGVTSLIASVIVALVKGSSQVSLSSSAFPPQNSLVDVSVKINLVKDMDTAELVAYLESKNANRKLIQVCQENSLTGTEFIMLTVEDLRELIPEFRNVQIRAAVSLISEAKSN